MSHNLLLDPVFGVNPMLTVCFFCQEDKNEIILWGQLNAEQRKALGAHNGCAPHKLCIDRAPCNKCKEYMAQGIILISVDEEKSAKDINNPWRSGAWLVVKEDAVKRFGIEPPELLEDILTKRVAFIPDDAWDKLGLPRGSASDATAL